MISTFLLIDLFLLLIPFVLVLDKKATLMGNWKSILISCLVVTVVFSEIAIFLTGLKAWSFNEAYLMGINFRGLPLEQYLFLFAFSFAGLGTYNYLNAKFPNNDLQKYSLAVSHLLIGICVAMLFFAYKKWYTVYTFAALILLLLGVEYNNTIRFMYKFYRAFVVMLIPFLIYSLMLDKNAAVTYDPKENLQFDIANIPFENIFFTMAMLLMGVYLMEVLKRRYAK